jgi:hypothetical protein
MELKTTISGLQGFTAIKVQTILPKIIKYKEVTYGINIIISAGRCI